MYWSLPEIGVNNSIVMPYPDEKNLTKSFSYSSYGITDVGNARKYNEDSMLEMPEAGIWIVADGMGGHDAGDVASQMIVNTFKKIRAGLSLSNYIDTIEDIFITINNKLINKARLIDKENGETKRTAIIGSTVAMMLAYDIYCAYFWVGDSRLYRLRDDELRQMTTDHSHVEEYVAWGLMTREEAAVHPHGNVITRAVGVTPNFFLDMDIQEMKKGDRYLLCSDGLTKHIKDFEFHEMLLKGTTETVCKEMIALTLERGAGDNVTAIVIDID